MSRKKVLLMTQTFYPVIGSAGNRMKNLYELFATHQIETDVLTTEPAYPNRRLYRNRTFWDDQLLNDETDRIIRLPLTSMNYEKSLIGRLFFYLELMFRFSLFIWRERRTHYDFIYVSSPPIFIIFPALLGKWLLRSQLIIEIRDLWPDSLLGVKKFSFPPIISLFRYIEKTIYRHANVIVINSLGFKRHIENKNGNKAKITYIPNGPRANEIIESKQPKDTFRVVYSGNLGLAQDIERLQGLASRLYADDIPFFVIGYGIRADDFSKYVKRNNLTNVHLLKPTTRKECLQLISTCHVAITFLTNVDIFSTVLPGKIIDYMTCKTPIVAGVEGVAAKTIVENKIGYVFEYDDMENMVKKIKKLKSNPDLVAELEQNCVQTVKEQFLFDNNITDIVEIINSPV